MVEYLLREAKIAEVEAAVEPNAPLGMIPTTALLPISRLLDKRDWVRAWSRLMILPDGSRRVGYPHYDTSRKIVESLAIEGAPISSPWTIKNKQYSFNYHVQKTLETTETKLLSLVDNDPAYAKHSSLLHHVMHESRSFWSRLYERCFG